MKNRRRSWVAILVCGMPLLSYGYVVLFWLLASAALGHWARPYVNDPKGFLFGIPSIVSMLLCPLSCAMAPVAIYLGHRRKKILKYSVAYVACFMAEIIMFRLDIFYITTWIAD